MYNSTLKSMKLILLLVVLAVGLLGAFGTTYAQEGTGNPPAVEEAAKKKEKFRQDTWDVYVYGNGEAIAQIFYGVRMLLSPDVGKSGFVGLMTTIAVLGFFVLAVMAGFDPTRNMLRMFGYVFLTLAITALTTKVHYNVNVEDVVDSSQSQIVAKVPALIVLPAALTTLVGKYFTDSFETYFSTPSAFKMASGAGQFNLFAKMVEESNQYGFTTAELKKSFSSYVSDCVVPALALGNISESVSLPDGTTTQVSGIAALMSSANLMETFKKAAHPTIMTTYFHQNLVEGKLPGIGGLGEVVSCTKAYNLLEEEVKANATAILEAGTEAWEKAGIMVPFDTAFKQMLEDAARGGAGSANAYASPNSFIMQQGFLNSMSGAFRTAALQTGNNELMQAAALSQAETTQKSAWVTSFSVFNNMIGYVFSVLQAFIFAITPILIVAMLVPGIGKGIFTNYAQILIWMTLWMPMLAIVNFIITLFAADSASVVIGASGITQENRGIFVERNKNLVIAAQFLGTMVPMLSWGIVKGAMAFTEFISSGVGSQFANTAGSAAATGNLSMNNMQMSNTSANKYNTAMASSVGFQSTNAFGGAGTSLFSQDMGGSNVNFNGSPAAANEQLQSGMSSMIQQSKAYKETLSDIQANANTMQEAQSYVNSSSFQGNRTIANSLLNSMGTSDTQASTATDTETFGDTQTQSNNAGQQNQVSGKASLGGGIGIPGGGVVNAGANTSIDSSSSDSVSSDVADSAAGSKSSAIASSNISSVVGSTTESESETTSEQHSQANTYSNTSSQSQTFSQTLSNAIAKEEAFQESASAMLSLTQSMNVSSGMDIQRANDIIGQMNHLRSSMMGADEMRDRMGALSRQSGLGDIDNYRNSSNPMPDGGYFQQGGGDITN